MLPTLYNNIANVYQTKGEVKSAKQYYEKALGLAEERKDKRMQGIALNNLGKLYFLELKEYDKGLVYLNRGLQVRQELGDKAEISKSLVVLANYHLALKNFKEARIASDEALKLGIEVGSLELQKFAYEAITELEEATGNHKNSLAAYKKFKTLNDSIQNQLAGSEITRLQLQYDFEKADQAQEQEKRETRIKYILIIVILSAGLLLTVLIAMVIRSRARQTELKRKNLVQDMEIKNKELTTNVMYLIRKNELINDVAERLLKVQEAVLPEKQKVIHEIIFDLQKEADNDIWKEFELRFNQVHSDFYSKLRDLYPTLSPADEKLCAFLRLNMSSKEIASITQQSVKSVEVARARLRKKLNLTNTNSNLVTHLSGL
jgi:tetratricopeptide (TPR) repeat protein